MKFNFTPEQYEELAEMFAAIRARTDVRDSPVGMLYSAEAECKGRNKECIRLKVDDALRAVHAFREPD